jgi:DNA polymerase-1
MNEKKLFLLDAYALIYRAYYALIRAPRVTTKGFNTSAIFGFCNTLDDILRKENPTHIAVCFDPKGGHTFRHEMYSEYKAQREKQPEDITLSVPYIKDILAAYHIPVIEVERYEADDVIGTLSRHAEKAGFMTYMMTPDKDYGQLVTDKVYMYRPALGGKGFEIRGPKEVCERYGISSTSQVIDLLALEGDVSDNIPGCPGVGEKTAVKLINEFGSVEELLKNTDKLKGALQKKVSENVEQIKFSKELVTIKTDVPLDVDLETLKRTAPDVNKLIEIFTTLEFRSYVTKLSAQGADITEPAKEEPAAEAPKANTPDDGMGSLFDLAIDEPEQSSKKGMSQENVNYSTATSEEQIKAIIDEALGKEAVGIATYTKGTEAMTATLCGIAIATAQGKSTYISIPGDTEERRKALAIVGQLLTQDSTTIVSHDIKKDMILARREGIELTAKYFDTSIAHYLLQPELRHELADIAFNYLDYMTLDYTADAKTRKKGEYTDEATAATNLNESADIVLQLYPVLTAKLKEEKLLDLANEIELPFAQVLAGMEYEGVKIDSDELSKMSAKLTAHVSELEQKAYELAGGSFNVSSPMQVGEILFERLKIDPKAKRTKKGAYSTTEEILEKYRTVHPIVGTILEIRRTRKLLATYIDALPLLVNASTGKIHTTFNQTVTATGRISSTNPNLQNIPIRTDEGREIRRAFIPDAGDILVAADYSQIELRLIADQSGDPDMVNAFLSGEDFHRETAAKIYKIPVNEVTDNQRRNAKTANFGIIYGISTFGLSERLGIPRAEAKEIIEGYYAAYPELQKYMDRTINMAREDGYVMTIKGRKRFLPDINSRNAVVRGYAERNAVNAPLQGSAADIIKIAMINIAKHFKEQGLKSKMIIQVHDELVFTVKPEELETVKSIITKDMESAYIGKVPFEVSVGTGANWLEAH